MKLILTNKNNQKLDLLNNRDKFILSAAEGLHGIETDIAETETPYTDGAIIDSVKALPRGIELTFTLRGNVQKSIEYFTSFVKSKQYVTLREVDGERDLTIKGIATVPPYSRMLSMCKITLSIYCAQPYWEDVESIVGGLSAYLNLLHFPTHGQHFTAYGMPFGSVDTRLEKTVNNTGDTAVGIIIELVAIGEVEQPRISCSTGEQNGWYMQLNLTLKDNDKLEICTVKGNKYVKVNGEETYDGAPILNYLEWGGADWLQLETGINTFNATTKDGGTNSNAIFSIIYKGRYE